MRSFLHYWRPDTVDYEFGRMSELDHAASEQLDRVKVGDHVWIVTSRNGTLSVIGRIIVGHVVDQKGAAKLLGTDDLWPASFHIVAAPGTVEPTREIMLPKLASSLRFESKRDRLSVVDDQVDPQQLQTMRLLTPESARELEEAFIRKSSQEKRHRTK